MDLVTVVCERDIQDILLQVQSVDLFVTKPIHHLITVEDGSKSPSWWRDKLNKYYFNSKHTFTLEWKQRPDMEPFTEPFNYGYRRQQVEKMRLAAKSDKEHVLLLDAKNIFIREVDIYQWPYKNGNGITFKLADKPDTFFPRQWLEYVHRRTGLPIPNLVPSSMTTPFALTTKYVRDAVSNPEFDSLFYDHNGAIPMTETFLYFFYVPEKEIDPPGPIVMGAMNHMKQPVNGDWEQEVNTSIFEAEFTNSPSHGLHRRVRYLMNDRAKETYYKWLLSLGFNRTLAHDYTYFIMTDQCAGQ
jgi:hypothetical protein